MASFFSTARTQFFPALIAFFLMLMHGAPTEAQVLNQWAIGEKGCGPCAVTNSLIGAHSSELLEALEGTRAIEKTRSFIQKYGSAESKKYREHRTCYSAQHGTADIDLEHMVNEFLRENEQPAVDGTHIQRDDYERTRTYIRRIHALLEDSIKADFHPLVSVRALAAEKAETDDDEPEKYVWNGKGAHWIAVRSVGEITDDGQGFVINFADSLSGRKLSGFIHVQRHRPAAVPMTFTVNDDGKEDWNWVYSRECLMINAPGMPLGTVDAKWHERTFTALRYLIFRRPGAETTSRDSIEVTRSSQSTQG